MLKVPEIPLVTTCNTCKMVFQNTDEVKAHYREEIHVINSKRRSQNLPPVNPDDLIRMKKMVGSGKSTKSSANSVSASRSSLSKGRVQRTVLQPSSDSISVASKGTVNSKRVLESAKDDQIRQLISKLGISEERADRIIDKALLDTIHDNEDEASDISDNEDEEDDIAPLPIGPNICIFDGKEFSCTEACLEYSRLRYGFFIPDQEYLTDLDGLLNYLGEKVKLGGLCLYCQKQFTPGKPCMDHMVSKAHCKLRYEDGVDLDEYEDFYDFSSTYEDCSDEDNEEVIHISDAGELMLPNGRKAGHRDHRIYFKQYFKPAEDRPSVLALRREELLQISQQLGRSARETGAISRMSDAQVMTLLGQESREMRKMRTLEQRAQRKYEFRIMKTQEYKSTVDKLRSQATTTAKIRDYHSILV